MAKAKRRAKGKSGGRGKLLFGAAAILLSALGVSGAAYFRSAGPLVDELFDRSNDSAVAEAVSPESRLAAKGGPVELVIARVKRVIDGDTLVVETEGREERVRLLNCDTAESVHPDGSRNTAEGKLANEFTKRELEGAQVRLEYVPGHELDNFGRRLAYLFCEGENFNVRLVREGYSAYYTKYGKSKRYDDEFRAAEAEARGARRGVWTR